MATTTSKREHAAGYHVWVYGERYWHRTLAGAERRAANAQVWASDVQIIRCEDGARM